MKWFNLLLICVVILPFTACERHDVKDLALIQGKEEPAEKTPANSKAGPATKPSTESAPAPQYFPSQK